MVNRFPGEGDKCCGGMCGDRCSCCPFGCTFTLPILCTILGMCFTWGSFMSCHYFQTEWRFSDVDADGRFQDDFGIGPWLVQGFEFDAVDGGLIKEEECKGWADHSVLDTSDLDGPLTFARIVTMPSAFLGFAAFCVFVCGACLPLNRGCLKALSIIFVVFGTLMILSLLALLSDWCQDAEDCTLQFGGVAAIFSFIFWVGAGISVCFMREPTTGITDLRESTQAVEMANMPQSAPTESVVEQTIVEPDGSVVKLTRKSVLAPDGSQTVTETREILQEGTGKGATYASASVIGPSDGSYPSAKAVNY